MHHLLRLTMSSLTDTQPKRLQIMSCVHGGPEHVWKLLDYDGPGHTAHRMQTGRMATATMRMVMGLNCAAVVWAAGGPLRQSSGRQTRQQEGSVAVPPGRLPRQKVMRCRLGGADERSVFTAAYNRQGHTSPAKASVLHSASSHYCLCSRP